MIRHNEIPTTAAQQHTLWGLNPDQLHDRFWAARGMQVVWPGEAAPLADDAELFLLTDARSLIVFRLSQIIDTFNWLKPRLLLLRIHDSREQGYQEHVITDDEDRFVRFERVYDASDIRLTRVAVTRDRELAQLWQQANDLRVSWRQLRRQIAQNQRATASIAGTIYNRADESEVQQFMRELVRIWRRPDVTIRRARKITSGVWGDSDSKPAGNTRFIGPVWVGAGRKFNDVESVVGPAVLWDAPEARPAFEMLRWEEIDPAITRQHPVQTQMLSSWQHAGKRVFDVMFASLALAVTLPFYPMIMLAIWLEDGRPFFFAHRRETIGGREFPCVKFRSMRNDAEKTKQTLQPENRSDGPHFYIEQDPRHTRIGRILRALNIDELPQFLNVLVGHMSIVGPRPSPYNENQFCPAWREARLSVRPGITGMWQVHRSRRHGLDFQEWIHYDLEYVEKMCWPVDLSLIFQTALQVLKIKS
jgi:lipopolysaccharide/colanic/teichoic acid biosynthesis glycosyltransferase